MCMSAPTRSLTRWGRMGLATSFLTGEEEVRGGLVLLPDRAGEEVRGRRRDAAWEECHGRGGRRRSGH